MYKTLPKASIAKWAFYCLPIGVLGYVAFEIFSRLRYQEFDWSDRIGSALPTLLIIGILSYANLYCEMRKWSTLIGAQGNRSLAWKAIMAGLVGGFLTPNRIGDIAGKTLATPAGVRASSFVASALGSLLQGAVTIVFGLLALFLYPLSLPDYSVFANGPGITIALAAALLGAGGFLFFRKRISSKMDALILAASQVRPVTVFHASRWAVMRYLIFASQLYLALAMMGISLSLFSAFSAIALLYLFQSYFPFSSFGDLGVREIFAMAIFSPMVEFAPLAAAATLVVWLINIAIPVTIGSIRMRQLVPAL